MNWELYQALMAGAWTALFLVRCWSRFSCWGWVVFWFSGWGAGEGVKTWLLLWGGMAQWFGEGVIVLMAASLVAGWGGNSLAGLTSFSHFSKSTRFSIFTKFLVSCRTGKWENDLQFKTWMPPHSMFEAILCLFWQKMKMKKWKMYPALFCIVF